MSNKSLQITITDDETIKLIKIFAENADLSVGMAANILLRDGLHPYYAHLDQLNRKRWNIGKDTIGIEAYFSVITKQTEDSTGFFNVSPETDIIILEME